MCIKTKDKFSHKPFPSAFASVLHISCTTSSPQQWLRRRSAYLPNLQRSRQRRPGASPYSGTVPVWTCPLPATCLGPWAGGSERVRRNRGGKTAGSSQQPPKTWGTQVLGHREEGVEGKSSRKMSDCATEEESSLWEWNGLMWGAENSCHTQGLSQPSWACMEKRAMSLSQLGAAGRGEERLQRQAKTAL